MTPKTQTIPGPILARLVGLPYHLLVRLRRPVPLKTTIPTEMRQYPVSEINAWLAETAQAGQFSPPPTLADLASGRVTLVSKAAALQISPGLAETRLLGLMHTKDERLSWLRVDDKISLLSKSHLLSLDKQFVTADQVCKIVGANDWASVREQYVATYRLVAVADPENSGQVVVPWDALVDFLPSILPHSAPEDWIDDRLADPDPLMRSEEAAAYIAKPLPVAQVIFRKLRTFIGIVRAQSRSFRSKRLSSLSSKNLSASTTWPMFLARTDLRYGIGVLSAPGIAIRNSSLS